MRLRLLHLYGSMICIGLLSGLPLQLGAWNVSWGDILVKQYASITMVEYMEQLDASSQTYNVVLPPASYFYDFDGNGEKGFANVVQVDGFEGRTATDYVYLYNGVSSGFSQSPGGTYVIQSGRNDYTELQAIEDVNRDGYPDFGVKSVTDRWGNTYIGMTLLSNPDGSYNLLPVNLFNNWDINGDGRVDLISETKKSVSESSFYIHEQQPNKEFVKQPMKVVSYAEYTSNFDPTAWNEQQESSTVGKATPPLTGGNFSAAWLDPGGPVIPSKLPSINIDLNRDGFPDLIDPSLGTIFYGTSNGTYVMSSVNGAVISKDLNDDGISDFIIYGGKEGILKTLIYQGGGEFKETQLLENLAADDEIYCYDFDKDGDIDILVTFSSCNTDGTAYLLFYENDGKGNFTSHEDAVAKSWVFGNCRDVDNDGYYDLLIADYGDSHNEGDYLSPKVKVMLRRGQAGFKFGEAEELFTPDFNTYYLYNDLKSIGAEIYQSTKINVEDIDNDGIQEVWFSNKNNTQSPQTIIHKMTSVAQITTPSRPSAPHILYNTTMGKLDISWSASSDALCSSKDLTYEVRIGSASGKGDMVYAHANADGSRRNFLEGNAGTNLNKTFDVRTWQPGTYHVAVQAINPNHKGSAWSEEATFVHSYVPAEFAVSDKALTVFDVLAVSYTATDGYQYVWDTDGATQLAALHDGEVRLQWNTGGKKTIKLTVTAPDGASADYTEEVTVFDNKVYPSEKQIIFSENYADYDMDGYMDFSHDTYLYDDVTPGLYHNDQNNNFTRAVGIFNQGLNYKESVWMDYDMDGVLDLFYRDDNYENTKFGLLKNNLNGSFTKNTSLGLSVTNASTGEPYAYYYQMPLDYGVDWNNDGLMDFGGQYINHGNGKFEYRESGLTGYDPTKPLIDWDNDGYWDYYQIDGTTADWGTATCSKLDIYHNEGNLHFVKTSIPFERRVTHDVLGNPFVLLDFDNDGYLDILFFKNDRVMHVLKNEENKRFVEGYDIVLDENFGFNYNKYNGKFESPRVGWFDLDNNGYQDIMFAAKDKSRADSIGLAVIYVDEPGKYRQGFISDCANEYRERPLITLSPEGVPVIDAGSKDYNGKTYYYNDHRTTATNTRPEAPKMVTAVQQDETLLIQWNPAKDKETPTTQMRYNLSVKKKGETGPGSYIISPLNGGNANMLAMPGNYSTATRFEIPLSVLPIGELEIQVQGIDRWDAMSEFSAPVTVQIVNQPLIQAPATACFESPVTISYKGTQGGGTAPVWNFDGGTVLSGSGYGLYEVQWDQSGVKKVSVTVGSETSYTNIRVLDDYSAVFTMPSQVFFDTEVELILPEVQADATFAWKLGGGEPLFKEMEISAIPGKKKGTLRIIRFPEVTRRSLTLTVSQNGCSKEYTYDFTVLPKMDPPVLSLVYAANNKNVITWNPISMPASCSQIILYKEGNYLNDFREIGRVDKSVAEFTDVASNVSVKNERYAISMLTASGVESPMSAIHQTVHLTINRGMADNQWNLIWNAYQGRTAASYKILRGANAHALREVTTLAGSATSYTDMAPDASEPYYALEFIPQEEDYSAASGQMKAAGAVSSGVRSNVVYTGDARNINYVNSLEIMTVEKEAVLNEQQQTLYLYAEVYPVNATYQQVAWSIVSGADIAVIDSYGKLQATGKGGSVTVQAKAVDGSNVVATRTIPVSGFVVTVEPPTNLKATVTGQSVVLTWTGNAPEYEVAYWAKGTTDYVEHTFTGSTSFTPTRFTTGVAYEWMVRSKNGDVISEAAYGTEFTVSPPDNLSDVNYKEFTFYPNPVMDYMYLEYEGWEADKVELVNIQGGLLQVWSENLNRLDLSSVAPGVYLLKVYTGQGVVTKKIMKK